MSGITITAAPEINRLHQLAQQRADEAIGYAKQAGALLLKVKADLAHGEFLPWLQANVSVSPRQAQRYMAATQGKATPVRALKCDTVSHFDVDAVLTSDEIEARNAALAAGCCKNIEQLELLESAQLKLLVRASDELRVVLKSTAPLNDADQQRVRSVLQDCAGHLERLIESNSTVTLVVQLGFLEDQVRRLQARFAT
ncbi:MAG: DUF3102 domain-containing protein [Burkholderiaceae bacterium]|nr:MAG: DUF3102 domain-containing protein [Burkholderiaceae bacterium]MCC7287363.1 DUF3102 domain-containing protein [Burkholderiaceae bacterium]MCG3190776.1 hypothetical protein [Burkholderiaceae bacterium]